METTIAVYNEFSAQLAALKSESASMVFDYESQQGNKEARSHIYKLRQTKAAVDRVRKAEKAQSLEYGRKVDSEAKSITEEIEAMIEVHQNQIDEIEKREKERIEKHKNHITGLLEVANQTEHQDGTPLCSVEYKSALDYIEGFAIDDSLEEFIADAAKAKDEALGIIRKRLSDRTKYETEQAELEGLRKKQAEQEQKERDEAIAKQAAEQARIDAERKAEDEKRKVAQTAEKEKADAERRELELKLAAERLEREKIEAERRAERAEKEAIEAAQRKVEADAKAAREEAERREANKAHAAKINNQAAKSLMESCELTEDQAKSVVVAIAKNKILNVTIKY